jgi:ElaB/YqjD/DUF883 family membrane-anchored ribosome-binding protein
MGATTSGMNEPGRSEESERIRREMERTRAAMGRTLGELQERLNPQLLKEQAKDAAYDATIGRVGDMVQNAGESIKQTGNGFVQSIKNNPVPAAIAALSIGWLFMRARSHVQTRPIVGTERYDVAFEPLEGEGVESGEEGPSVTEKIGEKTDELKQRAGRVAQQAQQRGREVQGQLQRVFDENPLAVGLGVIAVGLAIGLAVPITQKEDQLMGQARDRLLGKAEQAAHGALDKAGELANRGIDKTQEKIESSTPPNGEARDVPINVR